MASLNRHQQRQVAFQTLFSLGMHADAETATIVQQVLDGDPEVAWTGEIPAELIALIDGVLAHQDNLDLQISDYLAEGWTIDRLSLADLSLMRLAVYEAQEMDVPAKIAIDEALQLAHDFTTEDSRKFINAVLNRVLTSAE